MNRPLMNLPRDNEGGFALITALLVMMVASALVVASIALATHSGGQSAQQRNATAALHAADYGLQTELSALSASSISGVPTLPPCTSSSGLLPGTSLPAQWYAVSVFGWAPPSTGTPACTTSSLTRTIISTGYAIGAGVGTTPSSTPPTGAVSRTVVARITLQPAGATSNGGYGFPDAITALKGSGNGQSGAIASGSGAPLTVSGLSGNPVSIRADGPVTLTGGTLTLGSSTISNSLESWDDVTLSGTTITGNVASAKTLSLTNSTSITGNALGTTVSTTGGSAVSGVTRVQTPTLPTQPPVPSFPTPADPGWGYWLALTGGSVQSGCPGAGTLSGLYVLTTSTPCVINSTTLSPISGSTGVAIIVTGAANLTVTVPSSVPSGAQLYLVATNGDLTLNGSGAALPVFAYGSGTVTLNGTNGAIAGQVIGGNVTTSAATSLVAESVSTNVGTTPTFPPDFAFPNFTGTGAPPPGFVPQITDEYLCAPLATTAC
jgi:Tfp pilus assembly protein PilX